MSLRKIRNGISYFDLSRKKILTNTDDIIKNYKDIAWGYQQLEYYDEAIKEYDKAVKLYAKKHNVNFDYVARDCTNKLKKNEPSIRNELIDDIMMEIFYCAHEAGHLSLTQWYDAVHSMAEVGNKSAKKLLNSIHY